MSESDLELLSRYGRHQADDAFAEIVRRHLGLVHSAALRQVRSPQLAEEVAQSTFIKLAREAGRLAPDVILAAWLYQVTRGEAIDVVRVEIRRQLREQIFTEMNATNATDACWNRIEPVLDDAMHALDDADRAAILLRYFENKSLREVGATLGTTEDAAQKRVSRAVERLRGFFSKRGVAVGASGLVIAISANAVQGVPIAFDAASLAAVAVAKTALTTTATATTTKAILMTTFHKTLISTIAACALLFVGEAIHQANQPATNLKIALHRPPPESGVRMYPPEEVSKALADFGRDRKKAFAILKEAANDSDPEVRKRAICAMGAVGQSASSYFPMTGEPVPEAKAFLWNFLKRNGESSDWVLSPLMNIGLRPDEIPDLTELLANTRNEGLKRYLPEAIAQIIKKDPASAGPYISTVQTLLDSPDSEVRFEAACALARHEAAQNPQFLDKVTAELANNGLQQLMAVETLASLGASAEPAIQSILDYANSTKDKVARSGAFKAIVSIKPELRNTNPEVAEALKPW